MRAARLGGSLLLTGLTGGPHGHSTADPISVVMVTTPRGAVRGPTLRGVNMDDRRLERLGLLGGGLVFAVLVLVSAFVAGTPPDPRDGPAKIVRYLGGHVDELRVTTYATVLAVAVGLVWLGFFWRVMRRAEGGAPTFTVIAALGLVVAGALVTVSSCITAVTTIELRTLDASGAKFFFVLGFALAAASGAGLAVLAAATGLLALRSHVLPTWHSLFGLAVAVVLMVGALGTITTNSTISTVGFVGFLLWLLWFVATSFLLAREPAE
jgi:hypothetical protein